MIIGLEDTLENKRRKTNLKLHQELGLAILFVFPKPKRCHDLAKQLSHYLYFFSFSFSFWTYYIGRSVGKCHDCGNIVHRPCSRCISSVQEIEEDSIEFSLLTQTWRVIKLSRLSHYKRCVMRCPSKN